MTFDDAVLFAARDLEPIVDASARRARIADGSLTRVRRGAFMRSDDWRGLDADAQYRALIHAAATAQRGERVFSHQSAAALWGLPSIGPWGAEVHLLVPRATGGRSDPGVRRHALGVPPGDVTVVEGLPTTTLARTLVDIAATMPVMWAVAAIDAALHVPQFGGGALIRKRLLFEQWQRMTPFRGHARALRAIEFAETGSASTSESASRVTIAMLGFPRPELQRHFHIDGRDYWCDFAWDNGSRVGECDGESKYLDPLLLRGRTTQDAVLAEKRREDAIRTRVSTFQRWDSGTAMSPRALRHKLLALGLRPSTPRLRGR